MQYNTNTKLIHTINNIKLINMKYLFTFLFLLFITETPQKTIHPVWPTRKDRISWNMEYEYRHRKIYIVGIKHRLGFFCLHVLDLVQCCQL